MQQRTFGGTRWVRVVALATILVAALALAPALASAKSIAQRVAGAVDSSGIKGISGVEVYNADTGKVLYRSRAHQAMVPASNQKLVTAAGVLHGLGPGQRLRTQVAIRGTQTGTTLKGHVYLIGGGDPTLSTRRFRKAWFGNNAGKLEVLAGALRKRGIRKVQGRLIFDEGFFDKQRYVDNWPSRYRYSQSPALGALIVNRNDAPRALVAKPGRQAAAVFRRLLKDRGVTFSGPISPGKAPATADVVGVTWSPPMRKMVRYMNTYSDNFTAEMLLKALGRLRGGEGSTRRGAAVAKQRLRMLGVPVKNMRIRDGSGLSGANRIRAAQLARLLDAAEDDPAIGWSFVHSLAVGGRSGTLSARMRRSPYRGRVRAKTGTLSSVSALSGYAFRVNGRRYGFVVIQDTRGRYINLGAAHRLQDRIAKILVR